MLEVMYPAVIVAKFGVHMTTRKRMVTDMNIVQLIQTWKAEVRWKHTGRKIATVMIAHYATIMFLKAVAIAEMRNSMIHSYC